MSSPKQPPAPTTPAAAPATGAAGLIQTAITISGLLVPEAGPALRLFSVLEPAVQSGIAALIHRAKKKNLTAVDYLTLAGREVGDLTGNEVYAPAAPAVAQPRPKS